MITYIKKNIKGNYVMLQEVLNPKLYGNIGTDWVDYLQNKWVKLNKEQVAFHNANPKASVEEVWLCKLNIPTVPIRTIDDAKNEMIYKIDEYDRSDSVNNFYVNGMNAWFTPAERNNYKQSVDAAKLVGIETLSFFIGDNLMIISTADAEKMLAQIQLYADQCFIVTKNHKLMVEALANVETENDSTESVVGIIDSYDYTTGYPTMLSFEL